MKRRFSSRPILKTELIEVFERGRKSWNIRKEVPKMGKLKEPKDG